MEVFDYSQVVTHSTIFHADDVFGVAMCRLINPKIEIIRTLDVEEQLERSKKINKKALVFDIGLGKYDHHQEDKALRPDGTPYCGFGLLWRDFGYLLCPEKEAWEKVDQAFVLQIDKADNGVARNILSTAISAMNPQWNSNDSENMNFDRAVNVAMVLLKSQIDHANAVVAAKEEIVAQYIGGEVLTLERYVPWPDTVQTDQRFKDVLFVVFPSKRGGWNVQTVPKEPGKYDNRMDFPTDWLGHEDASRGITFAHTANFLISCDTKQHAIEVAKEAVQEGMKGYAVAYSI